jgi:hypothetical protein
MELCPASATRYTEDLGAWLSLVERLVRDQEMEQCSFRIES